MSSDQVEAFRDQLCGAAEQLFAASGPDGVTLRQLAEAVGVSPMTPYRYFESKDAILAAVRARAFNRFAETMETFDAEARARGPIDPGAMSRSFLRSRTDAYVDFALSNPSSYRLMFDVNQPTAGDYPELVAAIERTRRTLAPTADDGSRVSVTSTVPAMLWSAAHGAIMLELAGLLASPLSARSLAQAATEAIAEQLGILR